MRRPLVIAGLILITAAGGVLAYAQFRPRPAPALGDPAITVTFSIGALLRSETHRLTVEQVNAVLPLVRVLRDTDPNDVEASRALADEIMRVFTPEQRAELSRLREEALARRAKRQAQGGRQGGERRGQGRGFVPGGPGGLAGPGGRGFAPGGQGFQGDLRGAPGIRSRAEMRRRLLDRLIRRLEASG